ncbi:MAG: hypothetical protein MJ076_01905 [Clostridia bacterium]|nr:hypothetical protein [Clostridia bacterium]
MDNRYYDNVIAEMQPFLDEQNFKKNKDGIFLNDKKAVKIDYDETRQMYVLSTADINEGTAWEYTMASSFLFDDTQTEKDAESVGIDFTETLRKSLGIKNKRPAVSGDIDLPTAQKGSALNVAGFTKKVLDVFPQYKDTYKEHIAKYGNFLYMNFFSYTLIPQIIAVLTENNKKTVKKLFELLEAGYIQGDKDTANIVVASLAAAIIKDGSIKDTALSMLENNSHLKGSVEAFVPVLSSNKKLSSALIK